MPHSPVSSIKGDKERRPFFVENADFLGKHGLFYSRRIADPDFGAKFIGKAGECTLGILTAQDRGEAGARPKFGVLKLQREVFHNSTVGALVEGIWDRGMFDERKTVWRGRATYFATKRLFLRGFAQDAGYLDERDINLLASYEIVPKSRVYLAYNLGDTAAERAEKLRFKVAYLLSY